MGKKRYTHDKKKSAEKKQSIYQMLSARTSHIVHLTHNDLDAAGCDAICRLKYGDVFTIYSSVGKFTRNLDEISKQAGRGDTLSISDIGFQSGVVDSLRRAKANDWVVEWRDHHKWSDEEIAQVKELTNYLCVDNSVCATCIVKRDLMPDDPHSSKIAQVVCDYDLWKLEIPESRILGETCTKSENLNAVRDAFTSGMILNDAIRDIYKDIEAEKNSAIKMSMKHTKIMKGKYKVAFAPLYGYPSETAHAIRDKLNTDIEVIVAENVKFSIRSVPPISHLIAKKFNGGGHPPASGGSFTFSFADKLAYHILRKTKHYKKLFLVSENL